MAISIIKQKRSELTAFFQNWITTELPGMNIFYMGQGAPRPPLPYVAFRPVTNIDTVGFDERRYDSDGNETLRGQRVITCDLIACTSADSRFDGTDDAWSILQELRFSVEYDHVGNALNDIACRDLDEGTVTDISETVNTTNESRAQLTFTLSCAILQTPDSGEISTINAEGTGISPDGSTITQNISVTEP